MPDRTTDEMKTMTTKTSRSRVTDSQRIYDLLLGARTADMVTLHFRDGRVVQGALIFNQFKGTGRVINIDHELSIDFTIDDVRDLKLA